MPMSGFDYVWRIKTQHPDRFGQPCRTERINMSFAWVEFQDGFRTTAPRTAYRRSAGKREPVRG